MSYSKENLKSNGKNFRGNHENVRIWWFFSILLYKIYNHDKNAFSLSTLTKMQNYFHLFLFKCAHKNQNLGSATATATRCFILFISFQFYSILSSIGWARLCHFWKPCTNFVNQFFKDGLRNHSKFISFISISFWILNNFNLSTNVI